jgi:TPP-dependent pyruvate/acetoin dehydrogenase alpha subunit
VEFVVPRITPHSSQDDDGYRTEAELARVHEADPLPLLQAEVLARALIDEKTDARWREELEVRIRADEEAALSAPAPTAERARRWLVAGDEPHVRTPEPVNGVARSALLDG